MLSFKAERSNIIELFIHFDTLKKCPVIINLNWEDTESVLETLAQGVRARREKSETK
jgi:hypothetical protein